MRPGAALLPLLLLAACSGKSLTSEDKALDEAAASLEANSADTNAAVIVDADENSAGDDNESQPQ